MARVDRLLEATARAEQRHFWFRGFRYFVTPLLEEATRGLARVQLLDCGCGTGANVEMLGRYGRTFGFDLSLAGLEIGRALHRRRLVRASVAAAPFPDNTFDVVTSFDVLYSLPENDERGAVAEMFRVVKPGGHIVVNVAAMQMLHGDHSILSHERRRYSRRTLRQLLASTGFHILRLTYTNAVLFPPMAVARALQRWRGLAAEEDANQEITVPPAYINVPLTLALRAESAWVKWVDNPFGSSLLCLARKPGQGRTRTL